jgi:hypothetical protein
MAARKPLQLCFDRPVPDHLAAKAALLAVQENRHNEPPALVGRPGAGFAPKSIAAFTGKRWENGRVLQCRFLDGTKKQRSQTQKYAEVWSQFANVAFQFGTAANAEVRISFVADPGSWSALGTDCMALEAFPKNEATLNLGWLRDATREEEWQRVVLHEFGHVLSAIHEHSNPKGGIKWNTAAVYRAFGGPPNNWSKPVIDVNILQKYSLDQLNATDFDPQSIMLYEFPPTLIVGFKGTHGNTQLSAGDKSFIAGFYPKAKTGTAPAGAKGLRAAAAAQPLQAPHPSVTASTLHK